MPSGGVPGGERVDRRLWRRKGDERVAAVEKIEDQRKPEDFFGYRNRITPYGENGLPRRRRGRLLAMTVSVVGAATPCVPLQRGGRW